MNRYRLLLDSNTDWGQDLYRLRAWLDRHQNGRPLYLAHFSLHSPQGLGIEFELPPQSGRELPTEPLRRGIYVVSTNLLYGHRFEVPNGKGELNMIKSGDFDYPRNRSPTAWIGPALCVFEIENSIPPDNLQPDRPPRARETSHGRN